MLKLNYYTFERVPCRLFEAPLMSIQRYYRKQLYVVIFQVANFRTFRLNLDENYTGLSTAIYRRFVRSRAGGSAARTVSGRVLYDRNSRNAE